MILCPYDTCYSNEEGSCIKKDIVLKTVEDDVESLTCISYLRKEGASE